MKNGETFEVSAKTLLEPWVGHLVEMEINGESVKTRIVSVGDSHATVKVVPSNTKE